MTLPEHVAESGTITDCSCPRCHEEIESLNTRIAELEDVNANLRKLDDVTRRNNALFAALLANSAQGIALTGPDWRIVRVVRGITGFNESELSGALIEAIAIPEDRGMVVEAYRHLLGRTCAQTTLDLRVKRADGTVARFSATLTDMLDDPNVQGIVWNYSWNYGDITKICSVTDLRR